MSTNADHDACTAERNHGRKHNSKAKQCVYVCLSVGLCLCLCVRCREGNAAVMCGVTAFISNLQSVNTQIMLLLIVLAVMLQDKRPTSPGATLKTKRKGCSCPSTTRLCTCACSPCCPVPFNLTLLPFPSSQTHIHTHAHSHMHTHTHMHTHARAGGHIHSLWRKRGLPGSQDVAGPLPLRGVDVLQGNSVEGIACAA